jgi:hypothetical protein
MAKKNEITRWYQQRWVRIAAIAFLCVVLVLPALIPNPGAVNTTPLAGSPTPDALGGEFPTIPPGGTPVNISGTYVHPSGMFSVSRVQGWELANPSPEELVEPIGTVRETRMGTMFSGQASVIHTYVEHSENIPVNDLPALDAYFNQAKLDSGWTGYDGWAELNRTTNDNKLIINFEVYYSGKTYLARQITRLQEGNGRQWIMVVRLVVPNNNPDLLNKLEEVYTTSFRLWPESMKAPLSWRTLNDTGYMVRYPPSWQLDPGQPGQARTIRGSLANGNATAITRAYGAQSVQTEEAARAWVTANIPQGQPLTAQYINRREAFGYAVSYSTMDADGNRRSGVILLLNGVDGALYTLNIQTSVPSQDYLAMMPPAEPTAIPATAMPDGTPPTPQVARADQTPDDIRLLVEAFMVSPQLQKPAPAAPSFQG